MSGVEGCRKQDDLERVSLVLAAVLQLLAPTPSQATARLLVSELWNEEPRLGPLPWLSCPRALSAHVSSCSPCPEQSYQPPVWTPSFPGQLAFSWLMKRKLVPGRLGDSRAGG